MSLIHRAADDALRLLLLTLPVRDRLMLARTSRRMLGLADSDYVWRNTPLELSICFTRPGGIPNAVMRVKSLELNSADSMSHEDRLDAMLDLNTLDLTIDEYKSLRRGQCAWPCENMDNEPDAPTLNAIESRSLFFRHAALSLVFKNKYERVISEEVSRDFLSCIIHHTNQLRSRVVRFAVESVDKSAKVQMHLDLPQIDAGGPVVAKNEILMTSEIAEMLRFLIGANGFMPRLQSLSLRQLLFDSDTTGALIAAIDRYSSTLTQLNLSACSFDAVAVNAGARQLLGDALSKCDALETFVGQRSTDMHEVVLRAIEQQVGRADSLQRIDRVDLAGIFLPYAFVQRLAPVAARLRVLRVSDEPMDEDVSTLKGTHASYAERASLFNVLYYALMNERGSLESVSIAYGGVNLPHGRLVRRLAHALQHAYARFGKSAAFMTPGDPDYPTAWRGMLLEHSGGPDGSGIYNLDVEEEMYVNAPTEEEEEEEKEDAYAPHSDEENEEYEDEHWAYLEDAMEEEHGDADGSDSDEEEDEQTGDEDANMAS
jgi:hypothetical protein